VNHQPTVTLAYADPPSRWGVTVDHCSDGLRVVVPPVPSWRYLHPGYALGLITFAIGVMLLATVWKGDLAALPGAATYLFASSAILMRALYRLCSRTVIDVTRNDLSITPIAIFKYFTSATWPRAAIGEIKVNLNNGKMLVRITGKNMFEFYISPSRQATDLAVAAVREAVFRGNFEPVVEPQALARSGRQHNRTTLTPSVGIALSLVAVGAMLVLIPGMAALGCTVVTIALIFTMVAAGISYGTQENKMFM
jgi:hypothetical protein